MDLRSIMNDSGGSSAPPPQPPLPPQNHPQQSQILSSASSPNQPHPYQHYPSQHSQHPPPPHFQGPAGGRPAPPPLQPPQSPFQAPSNPQPPQPSPQYHHRKSSGGSQAGYPFPPPSPRNAPQGQHPYGPHGQSPSPYNTPHPMSAQSGGSPFTGPAHGHPVASQQLTPTSANSYGSPHTHGFPTMSPMGTPGPAYPNQQQQRRPPYSNTPTTPSQPQPMAGSPVQGGNYATSPAGEPKLGKVRERMFAERQRERELEEMQAEQRERDRLERERERERERDLSVSPKTRVPMYLDERKESVGSQKEDWAVGRTNENYSMSQSPVSQRMPSGTPVPSFPAQQQPPQQRSQPPTPTHGPQNTNIPSPRHPPPSPQRFSSSGYSEKMDIDNRTNSETRPSNGERQAPQWAQEGQVKIEKKVNGFDSDVPPHLATQDQSLTSSRLNMGPPPHLEDTSSHAETKTPIKEEPGTQLAALPHSQQQHPQQNPNVSSPAAKRGSFAAPPRPQPGQIQVPVNPQPAPPGSASSPTGPPRKRPRHDEPPIFARKASRSSSSSPVIQNRRQPPPGPSAMSQQQPLTQSSPSQSAPQQQNPTMQSQPQQGLPPQATAKPPVATAPPPSHVLGPWEPCITNIQPYEELTRHICDFLFIHVVTNEEFGPEGGPNGAQLEIEAKLGVLADRNKGGDRLYLPVKTETILDSDDPSLKVNFRSNMTEIQHKRMNEFLNRTFTESQRQAQQSQHQTTGQTDYPAITAPRIPLTYKHLRERDSFYEVPVEAIPLLPPSISRVPNYRHRLKLRITTDQKTGKVLNKIIKARIADLNVYSPKTAFDWRISINMEMPWHGDVEGLMPHGGGVQGGSGERNKDRLSYQHLCFSVDLTQVTAAAGDPRGGGPQQLLPKKDHELEIEVDAKKVREQGMLSMEGRPNGFQDLVRGFVDNVRVLTRELGETDVRI
ncbi:hypothetical protein ABW19_dt0204309 [Dactylella cylindrospora]|nr:hypothetical protein ABW19_dt0204309 [Dactylella cylindrospora]